MNEDIELNIDPIMSQIQTLGAYLTNIYGDELPLPDPEAFDSPVAFINAVFASFSSFLRKTWAEIRNMLEPIIQQLIIAWKHILRNLVYMREHGPQHVKRAVWKILHPAHKRRRSQKRARICAKKQKHCMDC